MKIYSFTITVLFFISTITAIMLGLNYDKQPLSTQNTYPLLSSSIRQNNEKHKLIINVSDLRQSLFELTASYSANLGLYFDYMPTSTTIGINQRENFSLASLLKIPVAMAALEKVAEGSLTLDESIIISPDMLNKNYGDLWKKGAGTNITVKEALELLLKKSDNTASEVLMSKISSEEVGRVFTAFDFPTLKLDTTLVITPKSYTSILRSLYYSTHLEPEYSNMILELLIDSVTLDNFPSPIPSTIKHAHKIGVHDLTSTYSDCGIVYYPKHPYVICVMVKNKTQPEAAEVIRNVIKTTYTFIDQKAKELE